MVTNTVVNHVMNEEEIFVLKLLKDGSPTSNSNPISRIQQAFHSSHFPTCT